MRAPDCCSSPELEADPRWKPQWGGMPSRVLRCSACAALWCEELVSRMGFDGDDDREWEDYTRLDEETARQRFEPADA